MQPLPVRKIVLRALTATLCLSVALPPAMVSGIAEAKAAEKAQYQTLLGATLGAVSDKYEAVLARNPQQAKVLNTVELQKRAELGQQVEARLKGLKDGSISASQLREEMIKLNQNAVREQKQSLFRQVHALSGEKLDELARGLKTGTGIGDRYRDARLQYDAAFTRTEKANALFQAVSQDIDHQYSIGLKRSGFMTARSWERDLLRMRAMHGTKDGKNWKKILLFTAIGVAAVGIISYGLAQSSYNKKVKSKQESLDREFEAVKAQLDREFSDLQSSMTQQELDFLRNNGFVYTTCGTWSQPDSILCNRYGYQLFSGSKTCSVMCWKNAATGKETLHSSATCTSPFIPANCYDPAEYEQGFADGYDIGYADGEYDGDIEGWDDGAQDGDDDGYSDGYDDGKSYGNDDGYDAGYAQGYDDGYYSYTPPSSGESMSAMATVLGSTSSGQSEAFKKGYAQGNQDALLLLSAGVPN